MMKGAKASIIEAIGDTPIVKLSNEFTGVDSEIYVKLEYLNPGGSTKDRIGVYMIDQAVKNGKLQKGGTIIEGTSGNTGVGIAIYAAIHGYKCVFVLNDKQSKEKMDNLRAYGAQVVVCPTDVLPEDPKSYYSVSKRLATTIPNSYYVNQYDNLWNRETHYKFTAPEIHKQTEGDFDVFMAAVGTGGTISGCAQYFKEHLPNVKVVGVDCYGSIIAHYWKTGEMSEASTYVLEGIGEDFIPENYDFEKIDGFEVVGDKESFLLTRRLLSEEAVYTGGSAGAAVLGAIRYAKKQDSPKKILVLLHDSGNRYSSKIFNNDWMSEHDYWDSSYDQPISKAIESLGINPQLIQAEPSASVGEVMKLMTNNNVTSIPIVTDGIVVGIAKQEDITKPLFEETLSQDDNIATVYTGEFSCLDKSSTVNQALREISNGNTVIVTTNNKAILVFEREHILKLMSR